MRTTYFEGRRMILIKSVTYEIQIHQLDLSVRITVEIQRTCPSIPRILEAIRSWRKSNLIKVSSQLCFAPTAAGSTKLMKRERRKGVCSSAEKLASAVVGHIRVTSLNFAFAIVSLSPLICHAARRHLKKRTWPSDPASSLSVLAFDLLLVLKVLFVYL